MAIFFNPGDDFAQRRILVKKIEEKPEENINDNPPSSTSTNNNSELERVIENSADIILGNINRALLNRRPLRPLPPLPPAPPIVTSDDEKSAEVGFESYAALRNYVFSGASADFNKTYTDITFRGGCQAADTVAKRHVDDFASVSKEDLLKEFGGLDMVKYDMKMREAINIVKGE